MSALSYLLVKKFTGRIRNIYRKPLSAILTTLGIIFFIAMVVLMLSSRDTLGVMETLSGTNAVVAMYSAFVLLMAITMAFQKRTALLTAEDAANILPGPFSRRTVLKYVLISSLQGSLTFSMMATMYLFLFAGVFSINPLSMLLLFVGGTMIFYFVTAGIDYFYLMSIASPKFNTYRKVFFGAFVLIILVIVFINLLQSGFDFQLMMSSLLSDSMLDMVPIFGWLKLGITAFIRQDYLVFALAFAGIFGACVLATLLVLGFKHDFYEQVTQDAEWYAVRRKKAQEGRVDNKVYEVKTASFGSGAAAISSNVLLQMQKTKTWINRRDLLLILLYLAIAYFGGLGFTFYQYYILIIVFTTISSDSILQELKQPYIYLIPDKPLKKLTNLVLPITLKSTILVLVGLILGWIAFQASFWQFLTAFLTEIGYILVLVAGSVWSLRLLKSRSNAVSEQFIKMGIILLALLPAIGLSVVVAMVIGFNNPQLMTVISLVSLGANIIVGAILILLAKSLLNGTDIMAE